MLFSLRGHDKFPAQIGVANGELLYSRIVF
jgi:hypothetical protein